MRNLILIAALATAACTANEPNEPNESSSVASVDDPNGLARWIEGSWLCVVQYLAVPGFPGSTSHTTTATWSWLFADDTHIHTGWEESGAQPFSFSDSWTLVPPVTASTLNALYTRQSSDGAFVGGAGFIGGFGGHLDGAWVLPLRFGNPIYWNVDFSSSFPPNGQMTGNFRVSVNSKALANYANFNCDQIPQ